MESQRRWGGTIGRRKCVEPAARGHGSPFPETSARDDRSNVMTPIQCDCQTDRKSLPDTAAHVLRECWFLARSLVPEGRTLRRRLANRGGPRILLLPGLFATDAAMRPMRMALRYAGYRAYRWGLGRNMGASADLFDRLDTRIDQLQRWDDRPVILLGWSLGGLIAREYAKVAPHRVRAVITLGSPFSGDLSATMLARVYEWVAGHRVSAPPIECTLRKSRRCRPPRSGRGATASSRSRPRGAWRGRPICGSRYPARIWPIPRMAVPWPRCSMRSNIAARKKRYPGRGLGRPLRGLPSPGASPPDSVSLHVKAPRRRPCLGWMPIVRAPLRRDSLWSRYDQAR